MSIEIRDVSKKYGTTVALKNVSLSANAGSSLCVQGKNGTGKSTILKIMALITEADEGSMIINGRNLAETPPSARNVIREEQIGYSFQEPLLIPYLTATENVLLGISSSRIPDSREGKAKGILSALGLSHRLTHSVSSLSVGEKKRVDIARAILRNTKILIADEPLASLDPDAANLVIGVLRDFNYRRGLVVASASDPAHSQWADRVQVLS